MVMPGYRARSLLSTVEQPGDAVHHVFGHVLVDLVRELDEGKRELLAMRFAAGLTSREIAAVLGKSETAIKKQLTRIVRNLKERYRES